MNRSLCHFTALAAMLCAGAAVRAGEQPAPAAKPIPLSELFPEKVLARARGLDGRGFEIKSGQLEQAFMEFRTAATARGQQITEDQREAIEAKLVERLIVTRCLVGKATAADKDKAKEATDKIVSDYRAAAGSEAEFNRRIIASGLTTNQFREQILERAMAEEVFLREVKNKIVVAPEQIKKFYDENPKDFEQPEMVRCHHLLLATRDPNTGAPFSDAKQAEKKALAEKLVARARGGEDLGKLAREFSEDVGVKENGGEYTFPRGRVLPEIEAAAFSLPPNRVSDVITTQHGFHIVKVLEKLPKQMAALAKVEDKVREFLLQQEAEKLMPPYLEKLKKDAGVEILSEKYRLKETSPAKGLP
jgi:peptidyl-prolyl cis-trans isomerase C